MKKLLAIVVLGLIWTNNSFSDEISGKWISNYSGSLFEIIPKDKKSYEVYMLYSGRHFREYKSGTELIAKFEKKTTGYSGTFKVLDNESLDEFFANAKFKIKDNEIKINVKGKNPNSNKKFKFTVNYVRYNETDPLPTGEVLFGLKIGNNYKNYKYLREFNFGNDYIGYRPTKLMNPPSPHPEFGAYIIETTGDTNQIFSIKAFHKRNSGNLSEGQCLGIMKPFRNFIPDKYKEKYIVVDPNSLILLKGKKIGDVVGSIYDNARLYDQNYRHIYYVFVGCMKGDVGQYIGYISLTHKDLSTQDFNYRQNNKKKDIKKF